jgi:hypothetical protein
VFIDAAQLGVPEGTLKSDVYRLKRRYGELLREEMAQTVASPEEIDDELRHPNAFMASGGKGLILDSQYAGQAELTPGDRSDAPRREPLFC